MDSTKLIAFVAGGSSASSMLSGSLFSGNSSLSVPAKMENPFLNFVDLPCPVATFSGIDVNELVQAKKKLENKATASSTFALSSPTKNTEKVGGCLMATFHQTPKWEIAGLSIEMSVTKGNYGLLLLNVIANIKNYGGRTNVFRAVFLEKVSDKWQIKAGVQWTDEAFLKSSATTQRLQWEEKTVGEKGIYWDKDFTDDYPYDDLTYKQNHAFKYSWKPESVSTNIYQNPTIKPNPAITPKTQDFWNGNEEPLDKDSTISKPSAVLDVKERTWKKPTGSINTTTVKDWFNLFKDDKGSWQKISG